MKQLLLFLICNLAFLLTVQGNSAEIPPAVMFKQLSTTEGLSNNSVRSIYRDNRGFLWVGTESGLNKYDGYSFQQYYQNNSDLPDDAISEIFEGPDDNVWIRTSSGYSIYNYKTGKFDNDYKPILDGLQIPSKNILRMGKTSKNEFWAYDYSKLYIRSMDNSSIKAYPLAVEKISNLYIGVQFIYIMYSNGTLYSIYNPQIQISAESGTKRSIFRQKNKTKRSKKRLHTTLIKPEQKVNEDLCSGFILS